MSVFTFPASLLSVDKSTSKIIVLNLPSMSEDDSLYLKLFLRTGEYPTPAPRAWIDMGKLLNIQLLTLLENDKWKTCGDDVLWLRKLRNRDDYDFHPDLKETGKSFIDWAASRGFIETLKWAYFSKKCELSSDAIDMAAKYGHTDVVEFIVKEDGPYTHHAIDWAAGWGQLEIIKILWDSHDYSHWACDNAIEHNHLNVLEYMLQNEPEIKNKLISDIGIDNAIKNNNPKILGCIIDYAPYYIVKKLQSKLQLKNQNLIQTNTQLKRRRT